MPLAAGAASRSTHSNARTVHPLGQASMRRNRTASRPARITAWRKLVANAFAV
jgi:hypothetical protein